MWSIELWPFGGFIVRQLLPAQCERFLLFYVWKIITTRNARPYPLPRISPPLPVPPRNWRKSSPGNPKTSLITHQATGFGGDGGRKTRWPFSGLPTADKTRSYLHCRRRRMRSKHRSVLSAFRKLMLRARNGLGSRVVRCRTTVIGNDRAIKLVYFFRVFFEIFDESWSLGGDRRPVSNHLQQVKTSNAEGRKGQKLDGKKAVSCGREGNENGRCVRERVCWTFRRTPISENDESEKKINFPYRIITIIISINFHSDSVNYWHRNDCEREMESI